MSDPTVNLDAVFRDSADPILIEDMSGRVLDLNREAEKVYGWSRADLIGQSIKRIVPPERHYQADDLLQRCLSGEKVRNVEGRRVSRHGDVYEVLLTLSLLYDGDGKPAAIASIAKDITSLRQKEAEAKRLAEVIASRAETERQLADALDEVRRINFLSDIALELTGCGYWHVDYSDPEYYYASRRAARILGEPIKPDGRYHLQDEWYARIVQASPKIAEQTMRRYKDAVDGRYANYDATYPYRRPLDGKIVWVHAAGSVVRADDGTIEYMYGVYQDITQRIKVEHSLHEAQESAEKFAGELNRNRAIVQGIMDATDAVIYVKDLEGRYVLVNKEWENVIGLKQSETIGRNDFEIQPPDVAEELVKNDRRVIEGRKPIRFEETPDEGPNARLFISNKFPLFDPEGNVYAMGGISTDISELKRQEKELRQARNEAEAANERLKHELAVARELSDAADREHQIWLQGDSIAVRALRESIQSLGQRSDAVLMTGPPGAGQQAVARAIHRNSPRASRPFIYVSCPHVTNADETLLGTERVDKNRLGKLSLAEGGTLYLEGVDALNRSTQVRLATTLRAAAEARAEGRIPAPNVRVIAHAAGDLAAAVREGDFDDELARLLGARRLAVPSLAERREDIVTLANRMVDERARSVGKAVDGLSPQSERMLADYSWPGNLGELQNVIERAVVLATGPTVEIPPELLREGRRIGGYTLERRIGSGAMGDVWLAHHALLARPAAVKVIRQDALEGDGESRAMLEERFQREAKATALLRSPHTVNLYDFGVTEDGGFYYVMEYLNGVDLSSLVSSFGPLSPERAVYLLRQACMSVGEAHGAGLIHRDIKPANFFVCRLGPHYDFLKLLDFGIVRQAAGNNQTFTSLGQIRGTPATVSPEVVQGKAAGFRSDIYGLGCVAYWLLAGRHIFDSSNPMTLMMNHVAKKPDPLSSLNQSVPPELEQVVADCLAKDPEKRPESAFELEQRLASIPFDNPWNTRRALEWWNSNDPGAVDDEFVDFTSETIASGSKTKSPD